ncbi:oxidoreductase [Paenibacillus yonginensis]|uniref:Oxidoreductase n=1 Tax=Paenibacillus yonginensis TaxID=1462996 RepID=A0A1B1N1T9_9BACL|nr:Gfo/Idh/MocA family oxidoreductase [Paenibacillus yonginensis]ANS75379.1 oxidoreductase [Paenibacillus yonginensis]
MSVRVGIISYWHVHAWDYTKQAQSHPDVEIAAVWDELPERGQEAAGRLGVPFIASLDELLGREDIDGVVVVTPTNRHREVMVAAAKAGKHIFTEKVIAATTKELNEILREVENQKIKFTVSLPRLNDGYTLAIQDILSRNPIGQITYVRVRLSHNGATAGWLPEHFYNLEQAQGGALIDLGCHPMYLTNLFLGQPITGVSANFGYVTGKDVEDNAVATLYTASGAIGVVEAGFVNNHSPFTIEIHGTEGTLLYGTPEPKLLLRTSREVEGVDPKAKESWVELPLKPNRESAFDQWVAHIQKDTAASENIAAAVQLTSLMEAANLSAAEKRIVTLEELEG